MTAIANVLPVAWRLVYLALVGAVVAGLGFWSWPAAGAGFAATFAAWVAVVAVLVTLAKRAQARETSEVESA